MKKQISKKHEDPYVRCLVLIAGVIGALLVSTWLSSLTQAAPMIPPPLPSMTVPPTITPTSAPKPTSPPTTGGFIELHVQFPQAWPWDEVHWQELWTIVQWQDDKGVWHDVEGWQGTLHEITTNADGSVVGKKAWWTVKSNLGKGPFRWQVYRSREGRLLTTSKTFDLPETVGQTTIVEVTLWP